MRRIGEEGVMIKKLLAAVSLMGTLGATAPAFADWYGPEYVPAPPPVVNPYYAHGYDRDDWRWRDRDDWRWRRWHRQHEWRDHEWREHEWREHHRGWRW
jgi:hypothetical protein